MSVQIDITIHSADYAFVEYRVRGVVMERAPFDIKDGSMEKCKEYAVSKFIEWHDARELIESVAAGAE